MMDANYSRLLDVTKNLSMKYKYGSTKVKNSHELVSYLMIM